MASILPGERRAAGQDGLAGSVGSGTMERKLVSIQRVDHLEPIVGADNILKARVMGWDVVVKKGEFVPGDPCVFFEIDSVLPEAAPWAEFMRPRGFRVKTARLRGVLSQGLALPVSILAGEVPPVGTDVSAALGVIKYEPVPANTNEVSGAFPGQVPRTDEIRLQSALGVLEELRGQDFYVTTKLDGTSATFFRPLEGELVVCSRNWALTREAHHPAWRVVTRYRLDTVLPPGFAIQGEVCGPGIQKNRLGLAEVDLFVFSVHDTRSGRFLDHETFLAFCAERGLRTVPVEHVVTGEAARAFEHGLEPYLKLAQGLYPGTRNRKEGIVVRPLRRAALGHARRRQAVVQGHQQRLPAQGRGVGPPAGPAVRAPRSIAGPRAEVLGAAVEVPRGMQTLGIGVHAHHLLQLAAVVAAWRLDGLDARRGPHCSPRLRLERERLVGVLRGAQRAQAAIAPVHAHEHRLAQPTP